VQNKPPKATDEQIEPVENTTVKMVLKLSSTQKDELDALGVTQQEQRFIMESLVVIWVT
jgi:hypothetical protein